MLTQGSAGTLGCAEYLREIFPRVKVVAAEALQCPTLFSCRFGGHRVHPETVQVEVLEPEHGAREQERAHLVAVVVEDEAAPVRVIALAGVLVGQFLVGQNYNDFAATELPPGDPAFAQAVPTDQYRSAYNFLAPDTFDRSYVNITTSQGGVDSIDLDGRTLSGEAWETVGDAVVHGDLPA